MADLVVGVDWTIATVLMVAGVGKGLRPASPRDVALAFLEGALAVGLVLRALPSIFAAAALALCCAYFAYALVRKEPCRCFGEGLPATAVAAQRIRNGVLVLTSGGLLLLERLSSGKPALGFADAAIGAATASAIIVGPWLFSWARGESAV
jgi:hypothetical protein